MKKFSVTHTLILSLLVYVMALGPVFGATEQRKVTQPDIEWGPSTDNATSAGGHVGGKIPKYFDNSAFSDNLTLYGNDLIAKGPWVDPRAYGFAEGNTGAQNVTAAQYAFDNAAALGSGGIPVRFPGGAFYMTGLVDTKGVPFSGAGPEKTKFFPTTADTVFKINGLSGEAGGFSINYTGTLGSDPGAVAIQLHNVSQARLHNITVWNPYRAFQLLTTYGTYGNIWQTSFDHVIVSGPYNYAHYIDSTSDSTTLRWSNSHVYGRDFLYGHTAGNDNLSKGWYFNNVTTALLSNCSMDGGDGSANGSVVSFTSGHQLVIDTFHLESFKQYTGGTSVSPFYWSIGANIENILLVSYDTDVGAGNVGYLLKAGVYSTLKLGSLRSLGQSATSGTFKVGNLTSSVSSTITAITGGPYAEGRLTLDGSQFYYGNDAPTMGNSHYRFMAEVYSQNWVKEVGSYLKADNTAQTLITLDNSIYSNSSGAYYKPAGTLTVVGYGGGQGFTDQLLITSITTAISQVKVVASDNTATAATRTYAIAGDNVTLQMSTGTYMIATNGKLIYPFNIWW